jgi:hypothetical protein
VNIFLWVLQVLLALHTLAGAAWKFKNTAEQTMPSLKAIPPGVWQGLGVFEIFCAIALVLPALYKPAASLAPMSAVAIAAVMVLYCVLHVLSGPAIYSPMIYWAVVAFVCGFIAYGRWVLVPLQ